MLGMDQGLGLGSCPQKSWAAKTAEIVQQEPQKKNRASALCFWMLKKSLHKLLSTKKKQRKGEKNISQPPH